MRLPFSPFFFFFFLLVLVLLLFRCTRDVLFVRRIRLPLYDLSERRCYQRDFERFDSLGRRSDLCRAYSRVFPTNFQRATFRSVGLDPRRLLVAPPASISPRSPSRDVRSTSYVLPPPRLPREYLLTLEPSETISPVVGFIYFSFSREKRDESFSSRSTDRALFLLSTRKDERKNELAERRRWRLDRVTPNRRKHRSIEQNHHLEDFIYSSCFSLFTSSFTSSCFEHRQMSRLFNPCG